MKQQQFHTVDEDATKLSCQDSCPTLLHTRSSGRGVNLPQTHDFVTEVVFCSTSAVGRGKSIRERASAAKQKSTPVHSYVSSSVNLVTIDYLLHESSIIMIFSGLNH